MMPAIVKRHNKQKQGSNKKIKTQYSSLGYQSIQSSRMPPPQLHGQQQPYHGQGGHAWSGFSTMSEARAARLLHYQQQAVAGQYAGHDGVANSMTAEQYENYMR